MPPTIPIGSQIVGEDHPTYIIAEIGINHNGDEKMAMRLIEESAKAGADAVKFQKRDLTSLYPQEVLDHPEKFEQTFQYMIPVLKEVELPDEVFPRLKEKADSLGVDFLCTPFDANSANFLNNLNIPAFKIASADLTNIDLIELISEFGKPLILSTGMSHWEEIECAANFLHLNMIPFALLHCRSVYPVWPRDVNLRMLNKLKAFDCPVGYSGHEVGIVIPLAAASMGASIIEKHITLDKRMRGPDHKVSLEPYEFKRMVRDIRISDQATGKPKRFLLRGEILNRELFGKSLVAKENIAAGTEITRAMIETKGPGKGISPFKIKELVGKTAERDIPKGGFFLETDLAGTTNTSFPVPKGNWGLIARFTDFNDILVHNPKVIEFHLAEKDFNLSFQPTEYYNCQLVVHGPEYIGDKLHDLCSGNEEIRQISVAQTIRTIKLAESIAPCFQGKLKIITHPGAMSMNVKLSPSRLQDALLRSLDEILPHCAANTEFLLENLPPYPWYFGGQWKGNYFMNADEIDQFCRQNQLGICFDLSHAALYCNAKEKDLSQFIHTILPHIRHIHFADGYGLDGEGMQIGEGDIDLAAVMPLFAGYQGSWVPEIWRGHLNKGQGFIEALTRLSKWQL